MKKIIFGLFIIGFLFSGLIHPVYAVGLIDVESGAGLDILYSGNEGNLNINQIVPGAYEIKASAFACTPGTPNCEPDKYEIRYPKIIPHIFGLGMVASANQVELVDFLDGDFNYGHCFTPTDKFTPSRSPIDFYESDICRMRTPVFVLPTENVIIAYIQPWTKRLRLSRAGQFGCPNGRTCFVLKKREDYSEGQPAPLVIIKGNNPSDMYAKYNQYLKQSGFFFKNPIYPAFGVAWETFVEFVNTATANDIANVVEHFSGNNIKLSMLTIGSGYWGTVTHNGLTCPENCVGCGIPETGCPATDSLTTSNIKFPNPPGLSSLFSNLYATHGIYPLIGMRHRVQKGIPGFDNKGRIASILHSPPYSIPSSTSILYGGEANPSTAVDLANIPDGDVKEMYNLNLNDSSVRSAWVDVVRNSYGAFKGIKHDDMGMSDQKTLCPSCATRANFPDNYFSQMYPVYTQKYNNDFLITGRLDWFSAGTDLQNSQGWVGLSRLGGPVEYNGYQIKHFLDSALTQIASGYPHPLLEPDFDRVSMTGSKIPANQKEFVRTMQLQTFMPVMNQSLGFWHLTDQSHVNRVVFASKLKQRLQQYTYDKAQKWYETGVPTTVQPLYLAYPHDETAYSLYQYAGNNRQTPWDEYLFGNALLVRPIFSDDDTFSVYLPGGSSTLWRYFLASGKPAEHGGQLITYSGTIDNFPVFLKEGEILIIGDPDTSKNPLPLFAYVFLESPGTTQSSIYTYHDHTNGKKYRLQAFKNDGVYQLKNIDTNQSVSMTNDTYGKGFKIAEITTLLNNSIPGDLNGDGHVNQADYDLLVANFGNPYTIFDYNVLVGNFGK